MDLEDEEWVNIPRDLGLLEVQDYEGEKIFLEKYVMSSGNFYKPNHFYTSKTSQDCTEYEPILEKQSDHKEVKEIIKHPILIEGSKENSENSFESELDSNQDPIFHVFFKKENQFVEMIMGSPRLSSQESCLSRIETVPLEQNEKHGDNCSSPSKMIKKEVVAWKESNQRLNFWKWGLSGIGVFCSVGMTAITICVIMCGSGRRHKQQNQKLRIQIYPDNKRIKQVVQNANEAMSTMRGVSLVRAQITYGGHYESI
ncbi:uncharacterized protein LOC143579001 [Bidens hawaiensis]|uniref:uncharacterized protein LOC143573028 n=1 Tax=Bidens hawaiensis TaxID=980011 RepID=UPI0040493297